MLSRKEGISEYLSAAVPRQPSLLLVHQQFPGALFHPRFLHPSCPWRLLLQGLGFRLAQGRGGFRQQPARLPVPLPAPAALPAPRQDTIPRTKERQSQGLPSSPAGGQQSSAEPCPGNGAANQRLEASAGLAAARRLAARPSPPPPARRGSKVGGGGETGRPRRREKRSRGVSSAPPSPPPLATLIPPGTGDEGLGLLAPAGPAWASSRREGDGAGAGLQSLM